VVGFLVTLFGFGCQLLQEYPYRCYRSPVRDVPLPEYLFDGLVAVFYLVCVWLICTTIGIFVVHWRSISPEQLGRLLEKVGPKDS